MTPEKANELKTSLYRRLHFNEVQARVLSAIIDELTNKPDPQAEAQPAKIEAHGEIRQDGTVEPATPATVTLPRELVEEAVKHLRCFDIRATAYRCGEKLRATLGQK